MPPIGNVRRLVLAVVFTVYVEFLCAVLNVLDLFTCFHQCLAQVNSSSSRYDLHKRGLNYLSCVLLQKVKDPFPLPQILEEFAETSFLIEGRIMILVASASGLGHSSPVFPFLSKNWFVCLSSWQVLVSTRFGMECHGAHLERFSLNRWQPVRFVG